MPEIRVYLAEESYKELKAKAKQYRLSLSQYSGLILSGLDIIPTAKAA